MKRLSKITGIGLGLILYNNVAAHELNLDCFIETATELARHPVIRNETLYFNWNAVDVAWMEQNWTAFSLKSFRLRAILDNPASSLIHQYIRRYSLDGEGFLIGLNGGLVAATHKTSDYYQGDEDQFANAISCRKVRFGWSSTLPMKALRPC